MSFSDLVDKKLKEEAKSKSQRRLMGWARACEKGEADDCPERIKNVAKSFKDKAELKKYAKTKHKGLPEKVDESTGLSEMASLPSKKRLFATIDDMYGQDPASPDSYTRRGLEHPNISNETYGRKSMIYLYPSSSLDQEGRFKEKRRLERELRRRGFKVHPEYQGGAVEIEVAYFKGHHWDESEGMDEAYGYRPTSRDDADEYGDWKMHQRQDQELDRRWEAEAQMKKKVLDAVDWFKTYAAPGTKGEFKSMQVHPNGDLAYVFLTDGMEFLYDAGENQLIPSEQLGPKDYEWVKFDEGEMAEGEAYGAEKWDDYEGDTGVEDEMIAWTGGSGPPKYADMDIRTKKLVRQAYKQQVGEFTSGWGEEPDEDTKQIFWNRAMHDAWATTRGQNEGDMSLADLDHENVLTEGKAKQGTSAPLAVEPSDAGPDKEWTPRFEPQPKDAGAPTWHEPKARWETIKHRDSLRGVINVGTRPDMKNKAYRNGEHNNPKMSTVVYDESRRIRVNHPTKGNGTVMKIFEGAVVIEWDSLNLRPLGPETLSKEEAQYVTVIENYAKSADEAEMEPKAKKKDKEKDKVEEGGDYQEMFSDKMLTQLRLRFGKINKIDPESPTYQKLTAMLDDSSIERLQQLAKADIKFLSMLARNRLMRRGITEDQYEQQPSFQVAPPPAMTIFQDQETDEDWSADPLATQRGADAAGDGDAPDGEMEEPDDAPDDLNVDHQELPDSGRAEQIAGEVFQAFDGEGGSRNEIDYKSDQVDFEKQSDSSHNKESGGESDSGDSDSEDSGSEKKQAFPARDKSEDKDDDSEEKDTERDDSESDEDSDEEKKKTDESLSLKDFDIEGILD